MASVCLGLGLVSSILSLACVVVAIASSQWLRVRAPFFQNDVGVMRHCDLDSTYCGDMERLNALVDTQYASLFRSVQAMYLLHCVGLLVCTLMYILYAVRFLESKGSFRVLTAFTFLTLAAGVYAVSMFGTHNDKFFGVTHPSLLMEPTFYGYGFYMAITGCCLTFLVMVFTAMEASHAVDLLHNMQNRLTVWTTPYTLFVDQEQA